LQQKLKIFISEDFMAKKVKKEKPSSKNIKKASGGATPLRSGESSPVRPG
jgi:hypothetical protein